MHLNRFIIFAGLIIIGTSIYTIMFGPKTGSQTINGVQAQLYPVVVGGWLFMVFLSILDLFGGTLATLASGLALIAVVYVILNSGFISALFGTASSKTGQSGTPGPGPTPGTGGIGPYSAFRFPQSTSQSGITKL